MQQFLEIIKFLKIVAGLIPSLGESQPEDNNDVQRRGACEAVSPLELKIQEGWEKAETLKVLSCAEEKVLLAAKRNKFRTWCQEAAAGRYRSAFRYT